MEKTSVAKYFLDKKILEKLEENIVKINLIYQGRSMGCVNRPFIYSLIKIWF